MKVEESISRRSHVAGVKPQLKRRSLREEGKGAAEMPGPRAPEQKGSANRGDPGQGGQRRQRRQRQL